MLKMKKQWMRFISYLLVIALIIVAVPLQRASASVQDEAIRKALQEALEGAAEEDKEEITEGVLDSFSMNSAGNWKVAHYQDDLAWNYFHIQVQTHIWDNNLDMKDEELTINYKDNNGNPTGKTGRADLFLKKQGITYLWEVKPASYLTGSKREQAEAQLDGYVASDKNYKRGGTQIKGGHFTAEYEKYKITYINEGNGLIFYWFSLKDKPSPTPGVNPVVSVKNSDSKKQAEDELGDIVSSGLENESDDLAAMVGKAGACLGIATAMAAATAASANTNTASAGLHTASVGCMAALSVFVANPSAASAAEAKGAIDDYMSMLEAFCGSDIAAAYRAAVESGDQEAMDAIIGRIQDNAGDYERAGEAQPPRDPLIIDFGAEGIELKALEHGVNFDLDNNGFAEKTAWIGTEDGFLALDRNGNGSIDDGGELFGDQVIMKNGEKSTSGFAALRELDDNGDGIIDRQDSVYEQLQVWIDSNHNGKSESGELESLEESGIVSIRLDYREVSLVDDETGTRIAETADVIMDQNGSVTTVQISEFWFPVNTSDTTHGDVVTAGNVPDILQAIQEDTSGELYDLCLDFVTSNDVASKRYSLKRILYQLTDAAEIAVNSRGGNIDARDLKVIEEFMGREFVGVDGSCPNTNAASILKEIYADIETQYYNLLNLYAGLGGYLKAVYEYPEENGSQALELSFLYYVIDRKIENQEDIETLLYDLGVYLSAFDRENETKYFQELQERYAPLSQQYADALELSEAGITYLGTSGKDSYRGTSGNEFIFGLEGADAVSGAGGNDRIYGNEGDDVLDGGAGNDILDGGEGDDTYLFAKGYGRDTVIDGAGQNTLRFRKLHTEDIRVNGTEDGKAEIRIKGTKDTLTLQDFCGGEEYRNYNLEFENVSVHATEEASPFRYIYGEEKDDVLRAVLEGSYLYGFQGDDTIAGSKGDDVIYGNEGNDSISAGKGDDRIFGGSGDDVLDGGGGDDFLYGGKGEDCYLFGRNYGVDIISDHQGKTVVRLAEDISPDDLTVSRVGENAVIRITNTEDRMIISGYTANEEEYILHFTDAEIFVRDCIADSTDAFFVGSEREDYLVNDDKDIVAGDKGSDRILGTDRREYVFGDSGDDQLLTSAGNDIIFGGAGNDYVNGGDGDDWIDAGAGCDFADGGKGDDQYLFRPGCGETAIMDSDGKNKILFGDGLQSDCIKAYRSNWNDLLITFDGWEDTLIIKNYCSDENSRSFTLVFADGTIVAATDKTSPLRTIYGTDDSEYMTSIYTDGVTKLGQEGDDQLVGSDGDDFLFGGGGNDRITGKTGDDVLDGGTGNDYLYGEEGDDTYLFRKGYGTDTIGDQKGVNQIEIYGFSRDQIKAYRTNWNNITITFEGSEDKLVIEGFFLSEANRNFYFTFNGGSKFHATAISSPLRTIYGTDADDYMTAMDDRGVTLLGEVGKDNLNGGNGADKLYGGAGDDRLNGEDGNDVLDGGGGDDILCGGAGKDTYLLEEGSGTDMIVDSEGINTISFGRGLKADGMTTCRTNWNDLTITFAGVDDQLVLCGFFTSDRNRQFDVCFADGTKFAYDDADNPIRIGQEE